ncbi:trigger factor [Geobacter pelophilus]|jgi:trigger factor|uniref:Trigger factor n=1 Tax=Geoanaerobacter pelophilus TaxID=60036 RepID=A0AAW4L429_9BACT|nr:trigger factor [Geoanaerobacter pelophilus]MBT0662799.1 trigger factor [Geoanaerobacter pelophilus]
MQITIEELSSVKKKINFQIPSERVASEIDKAYEKIRKNAALKGFRKGKAPQSVIEKHYSDVMADDVLRTLFNEVYYKALADHNVTPVSYPELESDDIVRGDSLKFSATVEVVPEITSVDYKGLKADKELFVADPDKVEKRLQQIRENMAEFSPAEAGVTAVQGDMVTIDFVGSINDVPFDGGKGEDAQLQLGAGQFIPGFEEQIIGMAAGDQKDIKVTFPADYHAADLAGKEATFAINLKEIKNRKLPELDDDFAKGMGDFETMEQLRSKISESIEKQEKERIEADLREMLMKALVDKNPVQAPNVLIDRQVDLMLENSKKRLASQGMTLEMMGMDEASYKSEFRDVAEHKVKSSLLVSVLARQEELKVEESDIEKQLKKIAEENGHDFDKLREFYKNNQQAGETLHDYLLDEKVFSLLISNAEITETAKA